MYVIKSFLIYIYIGGGVVRNEFRLYFDTNETCGKKKEKITEGFLIITEIEEFK